MNGLVGIQWGEVCVNLSVILGNMQAVGTDIVTVGKIKKVSEHQGTGQEGCRGQRCGGRQVNPDTAAPHPEARNQ